MVISFVDKLLIMFANLIRHLHNGNLILPERVNLSLWTFSSHPVYGSSNLVEKFHQIAHKYCHLLSAYKWSIFDCDPFWKEFSEDSYSAIITVFVCVYTVCVYINLHVCVHHIFELMSNHRALATSYMAAFLATGPCFSQAKLWNRYVYKSPKS